MHLIRSAPPAADRATAARRLTIVSAVVMLVSLGVVAVDLEAGLAPLLVSAAGLFAGLTRHLSVQELARHGSTPVVRLSDTRPVLRATVPADEVIAQIVHLRRYANVIVIGPQGWRVAPTQPILDLALHRTAGVGATGDRGRRSGDIQVWPMAREARWVHPAHPVDRLARPPYGGEVWLVAGSEPPRVLVHDDLLAAPLPHDPEPMTGLDPERSIIDVSAAAREALR